MPAVGGGRAGSEAKSPSRLPFPMLLGIISKTNDLSPSPRPRLGNQKLC